MKPIIGVVPLVDEAKNSLWTSTYIRRGNYRHTFRDNTGDSLDRRA